MSVKRRLGFSAAELKRRKNRPTVTKDAGLDAPTDAMVSHEITPPMEDNVAAQASTSKAHKWGFRAKELQRRVKATQKDQQLTDSEAGVNRPMESHEISSPMEDNTTAEASTSKAHKWGFRAKELLVAKAAAPQTGILDAQFEAAGINDPVERLTVLLAGLLQTVDADNWSQHFDRQLVLIKHTLSYFVLQGDAKGFSQKLAAFKRNLVAHMANLRSEPAVQAAVACSMELGRELGLAGAPRSGDPTRQRPPLEFEALLQAWKQVKACSGSSLLLPQEALTQLEDLNTSFTALQFRTIADLQGRRRPPTGREPREYCLELVTTQVVEIVFKVLADVQAWKIPGKRLQLRGIEELVQSLSQTTRYGPRVKAYKTARDYVQLHWKEFLLDDPVGEGPAPLAGSMELMALVTGLHPLALWLVPQYAIQHAVILSELQPDPRAYLQATYERLTTTMRRTIEVGAILLSLQLHKSKLAQEIHRVRSTPARAILEEFRAAMGFAEAWLQQIFLDRSVEGRPAQLRLIYGLLGKALMASGSCYHLAQRLDAMTREHGTELLANGWTTEFGTWLIETVGQAEERLDPKKIAEAEDLLQRQRAVESVKPRRLRPMADPRYQRKIYKTLMGALVSAFTSTDPQGLLQGLMDAEMVQGIVADVTHLQPKKANSPKGGLFGRLKSSLKSIVAPN